MMILFVVPPLAGDKIDDNHVRVEHHHADGLTYSHVLINGVERYVRSTSKIDRRHPVTKTRTIRVHLKPLPKPFTTRLTCAHIPTWQMLAKVHAGNTWPTLTDVRTWLMLPDLQAIGRLMTRKEQKLERKGYVTVTNGVPFLTAKGRAYLERVHA